MLPGTSLGHYRILGSLGKGGMGEVFSAEDTRLKRKVAIKVLPDDLATDPERLERFRREAEALAALNHPNIVTVYAIEEADGRQFLTMELVEGAPLSSRLTPEGLSIPTVVDWASQIADAMTSAHGGGVIHRDLKPANVMITPEGRVKVLDFGLSKRVHESSPSATTKLADDALTEQGSFIGTVAYMSPEQAQGKAVDSRTDVFSFGVLLYEMVVGQRPFTGDTQLAILSAILHKTPEDIRLRRGSVPAPLEAVVLRCLEKNPADRYQSFAELRKELIAAREGTRRWTRPSRRAAALSLALLMALSVVGAVVWSRRPAPSPPPPVLQRMTLLTAHGKAALPALSQDGRHIAYVRDAHNRPSLWVQQAATGSEVQIVPPGNVTYQGVTHSPDGNYVYYTTYDLKGEFGSLFRVPSLGGTPERVLFDIDSGVGMSAATKRLAFVRGVISKDGSSTSHIFTARYDGSDLRQVAALAGETFFRQEAPAWSPDGRRLVVSIQSSQIQLAIVSVDSGRMEVLPPTWGDLNAMAWRPGGSAVLVSGRASFPGIVRLWQVAVPAGTRHELTKDFNSYEGISLAENGQTLVAVRREDSSQIQVLEKGLLKPITSTGFSDGVGGLCWRGEHELLFPSNRSARPEMWKVGADGMGLERHPIGSRSAWPTSTSDGGTVFFAKGGALWRWDVANGVGTEIAGAIPYGQSAVVSRDDRWAYFQTTTADVTTLQRFSVSGGAPNEIYKGAFGMTDVLGDGRMLGTAYIKQTEGPGEVLVSVALLSPEKSLITPLKDIPILSLRGEQDLVSPPIVATPNGDAISYVDAHEGIWDVWTRNLQDGSKRKITRSSPGMIFWFAWSRQGRLAVAHGDVKRDLVRVTIADSR